MSLQSAECLTIPTPTRLKYSILAQVQAFPYLSLINTFETATGVAVPHKIVGRREGDIEKVWANPHKANTVLGWKGETPLADTMKSAWKWQLRLREKGIM